MSLIRLFIDEDSMDQQFVRALRARGVDVTTVGEIGTTSFSRFQKTFLGFSLTIMNISVFH